MFDRLLIANRGEIACRIARTARTLGIETIAVFSDADRHAAHVRLADHAVHIGPAQAQQSYLLIDRMVQAALHTRAQAIHPGYGFLSENADFADACVNAGLVFVGPSGQAIRAMGAKHEALALMAQSGVPVLPGYRGTEQHDEALIEAAEQVGFPLIIKPSAGGGGKGMSIVVKADKLPRAITSARRNAKAAFGDETLMLERYLDRPRHVEVQIFADSHGNYVHLAERDCSTQRRHQKVVEEAPAPGLSAQHREGLHTAAIDAARAVHYVGAGTVEFLVEDKPDGGFYFMEMNTRLQVEHPATEAVFDLDLVEWQLRVAAGEALPKTQAELQPRGHAIEVRLYAENPRKRFLPQVGQVAWLDHHHPPERIDSGISPGDEVTPFYDPMIAKIIESGADRATAIRKLKRTLDATQVGPLVTNIELLRALCRNARWCEKPVDTTWLEREIDQIEPLLLDVNLALAAATAHQLTRQAPDVGASPWRSLRGFRVNQDPVERFELAIDGEIHSIDTRVLSGERSDGAELDIQMQLNDESRALKCQSQTAQRLALEFNQQRYSVFVRAQAAHADNETGTIEHLHILIEGREAVVDVLARARRTAGASATDNKLIAPMPGKLVAVLTEKGASVRKGQALLVLEAMKMEHTISAPHDGQVAALRFAVGDQVDEGDLLVQLDAAT